MGQFNSEMSARGMGLIRHQKVDLTVMGTHQFLHDGQADAAATRCVGRLALTAEEGLEHARSVARSDAWAFVGDVDACTPWP